MKRKFSLVIFILSSVFGPLQAQKINDLIFPGLASDKKIYSYDPELNETNVEVSNGNGSGTTFQEFRDVTIIDGQYYASDFIRNAIFRVNPVTGDRTVVRSATRPDQIESFNVTRRTTAPDGSQVLSVLKGYVFSAIFDNNQVRVFLEIFNVGLIDCGTYRQVTDLAVGVDGKIYIATGEGTPFNSADGSIQVYDFASNLVLPALSSPSIDSWGVSIYDNNTLLVTDLLERKIYSVSLANGVFTLLSQFGVRGSGPDFRQPADIEVDGNGRIILLGGNTSGDEVFYEIDRATGNRKLLALIQISTSTNFTIYPGVKDDFSIKPTAINGDVISGRMTIPLREAYRAYVSPDLQDWRPFTEFSQNLRGEIPFAVSEQALNSVFGGTNAQYYFRLEHF